MLNKAMSFKKGEGIEGVDIKAASEMLGHADVGITLKIYHHVNAKAIREMHREFSPLDNMRLSKFQ